MKLLIRITRFFLVAYLIVTLAMLAWTFLWPDPDIDTLDTGDVIVCLGGGMNAQGVLAPATLRRVDRCAELYEAGIAPVVLFTGGRPTPQSPSAGGQMMRYAQTLGVPQSQMIVEPAAQSTLQNALFSMEYLQSAQRLVIVTEAFHLPRSYASFRWAAWEGGVDPFSVQLVMSEPVRRDVVTGGIRWQILARESIAIWFNLARAAAYSLTPNASTDWLH